MSSREALFEHVLANVIVGVVREDDAEAAAHVARTYAENGIRTIEVTMTTPDAVPLIGRLSERYSPEGIVIAAGTVRSSNDAAEARRAGATILVSPHTSLRIIDYALENDLLSIAGAATATEIITAWEAGASLVKLFPAPQLGGPDFIRAIRGPIRDVPLLAGGPVDLDAIDDYLDAGAVAINLGATLALPALVRDQKWDAIGRRAAQAVAIVRDRMNELSTGTTVH
jgi:2-dehydro-3-deoxyphosphogluconate aldolase / (4S)-4-hydroxy-2-oxoglutarate aldolase